MTRAKRLLFAGLVLVQVLVLVGMAAGREITLGRAEEDVVLQTLPVDPRDLFRGDYVVLRYEISTLHLDEMESRWTGSEPGDTVYVHLVERAGHWVAIDVLPSARGDWSTTIRGTVVTAGEARLTVEYGIEEYFVPAGSGLVVERADDVDVRAAIDPNGGAVIRHLIVDGLVWDPHAG